MASIRIERAHRFNLKEARHAVTHLAEKLAERFDIDWNWHRNTLKFQRSGVSGCIEVQKGLLTIDVQLGFLMGAFRGVIEKEINDTLDREFGVEKLIKHVDHGASMLISAAKSYMEVTTVGFRSLPLRVTIWLGNPVSLHTAISTSASL